MASTARKLRRRGGGTQQLLAHYVEAAGPVLSEHFRPDCCLNATWVAIQVLSKLGVKAGAASVRMAAANREYLQWMQRDFQDEAAARAAGAWSVAIDVDNISNIVNGWAGHLVAIVEGTTLLDSSAGQVSRPEKKIAVPQLVVTPWTPGEESQVTLPEGGLLAYDERASDKSFLEQPGFRGHDLNRDVARLILTKVKVVR